MSQEDTFTSTGRDMFVRFVTDEGNYGLTGTTDDPGFWAEWQFITDGGAFMSLPAQLEAQGPLVGDAWLRSHCRAWHSLL